VVEMRTEGWEKAENASRRGPMVAKEEEFGTIPLGSLDI
jgi:hypothetical protein